MTKTRGEAAFGIGEPSALAWCRVHGSLHPRGQPARHPVANLPSTSRLGSGKLTVVRTCVIRSPSTTFLNRASIVKDVFMRSTWADSADDLALPGQGFQGG